MVVECNLENLKNRIPIENKLRDVYFLTQQQISDILKKYIDGNQHVIDCVIADVEQQYTKIHSDIFIGECLYENLMSIEHVDRVKRPQEIIENKEEILDSKDTKVVSYMNFLPHGEYSHDKISSYLENYLQKYVQDFFVIHISEDVVIDKDNKADKAKITSELIQQYISRSRLGGINFYVFVKKTELRK